MLEPAMRGSRFRRVIVNRPNLRIPFPDKFVDRLRGQNVDAVDRRGKYLTVLAFLRRNADHAPRHVGMV